MNFRIPPILLKLFRLLAGAGIALYCFAVFFVNRLRYTENLSDDDQWSLWKSTLILFGDKPFRDFVIVGDPLDMTMSWLFQIWFGPTAYSEYVLAASTLTLGTFLFLSAAKKLGVGLLPLSILFIFYFLAAMRVDVHSTPKHLVLGLTSLNVVLLALSQFAPGKRAGLLFLSAFTCSLAFLYRHDFLAVAFPPIALAMMLNRGQETWKDLGIVAGGTAVVGFLFALTILAFTGSLSGIKEYAQDYVAIGLAKQAQSSTRPRELFTSVPKGVPKFIEDFRRFRSTYHQLNKQNPSRVLFESPDGKDLLAFLEEAREKCGPTQSCIVENVVVHVPSSVNLAGRPAGVFSHPSVRDLKGLTKPIPGVYTITKNAFTIRWDNYLEDPAVKAKEKLWKLRRLEMKGAREATYSFYDWPNNRDVTFIARDPLTERVSSFEVEPDISAITSSWVKFASNPFTLVEIDSRSAMADLESLLSEPAFQKATYYSSVRVSASKVNELMHNARLSKRHKIETYPISLREKFQVLRSEADFIPAIWLFLLAWTLPLVGAAAALLLFPPKSGELSAILSLTLLQLITNFVLVRWPQNVTLFIFLPFLTSTGILSAAVFRRNKAVSAVSLGVFLLLLAAMIPTLMAEIQIPRELYEPLTIRRDWQDRYREITFKPRSKLHAEQGGLRSIEYYFNRCTRPSDKIFVVGDKMSIPYSSQRSIFYSTNWHENVLASPSAQRRVANELALARNIPIFVSETPGGPVAGLSTQETVRRQVHKTFSRWNIVRETPVGSHQHFWLGFSRTYPFNSVDSVTGWPCASEPPQEEGK